MASQFNQLKRLVENYSSSLFCCDYNHNGDDIKIEIEFFEGISENSLESKDQEIHHQDGLLYDILIEKNSYKMMATFKTKKEEIYGILVIVNNTIHGYIPDKDYFGICHQFVREDKRNQGIARILFDATVTILKYLNTPEVDILMQDHVASKYQDSRYNIISFTWEDLHLE